MRTAATRPLWYASHCQKYGCQRKVAERNMPTTRPAKRTAPATANRLGRAPSASTAGRCRGPRIKASAPVAFLLPQPYFILAALEAHGSRRGAARRRGDAGFRPPPARGTRPRDLGPPPGLRGRPRGAGRLDPAVPAARDPRAPREDAGPEQGRAGRDRGGLQTRILEEPRRRVGRGEAGVAVPQRQ